MKELLEKRLTEHFIVKEFVVNQEEEFLKLRGLERDLLLENFWRLAEKLERIRVGPLRITSGWRSIGRNKEVGGVWNSLHLVGLAADFVGDINFGEIWEIDGVSEFIIYLKKNDRNYRRFHLGLESFTRDKKELVVLWVFEETKNEKNSYYRINSFEHLKNVLKKYTNIVLK